MTYEIEKDIPIPVKVRPRKYPWREMAVGDSFFVSTKRTDIGHSYAKKKTGFKFATRAVNGGIRVWRIE